MFIEKSKKDDQAKKLMESNILSLRKSHNVEKSINKIKDNKLFSFSSQENYYLITPSFFVLSNDFMEYWNSIKNKTLFLSKCFKNEQEITSKYDLDKNNLIKFSLFQFHQLIDNYLKNNNEENFELIKNFFDINNIDKLINLLYKYTNEEKDFNESKKNKNKNNNEIIIFNICKILIKLTAISNYFSFLIIQNNSNLKLILLSLKHFTKYNQFISNNLLILLYNLYLDDENKILDIEEKLTPFILEILFNYQNNPINNIIQTDFLFNLFECLSLLLNESTFHLYLNNPNINQCILLTISIYQNYNNDHIKISSLKCLSCLLHCIDENARFKINNPKLFINMLLQNLNIEINTAFIIVKTLEIISSFSYLFEIDEFTSDELINEIDQILIRLALHKEQINIYFNKNQINSILDNISIILLNFCLSLRVTKYIKQNTSIIKNVILILYNYSIEDETIKNLYSLINEFMDSIDDFVFLIICNFLEYGIIKCLEKYSYIKNYEVILIILNLTYKALDFGSISKAENNDDKNSIFNFVQSYLDKKGFNDILNKIISPDFGNMKCSDLAEKIRAEFFK